MLSRPDKEALLEAIARFLEKDVKPGLEKEPALAYRTLVASGLARSLAAETRTEEARETRELAGLRAILGGPASQGMATTAAERKAALAAANRTLCERIRARTLDGPALARVRSHLLATLTDELAVTNPRFDARAVIP
jgi:hypothetical protein